MERRRGLIDSNVLVAAAAPEHRHHQASRDLLTMSAPQEFATSLHCLSEFYNASTRPKGGGGTALSPVQTMSSIAALKHNLEILELEFDQHIYALNDFAAKGGTGPVVYDYLIGWVAVVHAMPLIVTWNMRHFVPLFPTLRVATPADLLQES